jgi:hypothetical protein
MPSPSRDTTGACWSWWAPELSTTAGHLLALGIPDPVFRFSGDAQDGLDDVRESWFASVRTSTPWRRVSLPFSRFRSLNPRFDGRLDLDKVRQIVFVLDGAAVKVGTKGTIWLDDLGVY